jgi:tripartite-type tricarboxylate transporter receptor subunit TctC
MQIGRRDFIAGMALAGSGLGIPPAQATASFPAKDISFIIPYAPGGGFDEYVRAVVPAMQARLPNPVNVLPLNIEGAAGARGATQLYQARPDGYTISIMNVPGIVIMQIQGGLHFDLNALTFLCNMGVDAYGIAVPKNSPLKSMADLQKLAKTRPIKFPCIGPAGTAYSATRIGAHLLGFEAQIIPGYKSSSDYIVATIRGDGDVIVASLAAMSQFIDSGMIRVLATFEEHSSIPGAEDATTLKLPDLVKVTALRPVTAPPNLPPEVAAQLSTCLINAMKDPKVIAWAKANRANLQPDDAETTKRLFQEQVAFITTWKKYIY